MKEKIIRVMIPAKVLPDIATKAKKKAGKEGKTISSKIEELLSNYVTPNQTQ